MPLVSPVFREVLAALQRTWEPVLPVVIGDMELETDPEAIMDMVQVAKGEATVVLIAFEINTLELSSFVSISYPLPDGLFELSEHFAKGS